ncbi:MAG: spondin domain-containing protein [Bacteroidota bacterium]
MRALALLLVTASVAAAQSTATYDVSFTSTWSAATHPEGFPSNPHYSPLIGAAHDASVALWEVGETATPGIERMAETGSTSMLRTEIAGHAQAGRTARVLSGSSLPLSPGTATMSIDLDADAPLVTLVTMLAPSPDWFVGVSGLDLRDGDGWQAEHTVDLFLYDAGTDDGDAYTSPNDDSDPKQPIARVESAPFLVDGSPAPLGTLTFRRTNATSTPIGPEAEARVEIAPNPVADGMLRIHLGGALRGAEVQVLDVRGREMVAASGTSAGAVEIETAGWAPGVYVARVTHERGVEVSAFTVSR